jgi:hypothetical protein
MLDETNEQLENNSVEENKIPEVVSEETKEVDQVNEVAAEEVKMEEPTKEIEEVKEVVEEEAKIEETQTEETPESKTVAKEVKEVVVEDYTKLNLTELNTSLKNLIENESIQQIKKQVDAIKNSFNTKFTEFIGAKKAEFIAEGGNEIDFHYKSDEKYTFNGLLNDYRKKIKQHYKQLEDQRNDNYIKKIAIIEELKSLITNSETATLYKEFQELKDRFFKVGPVPREKNEDTWQTYRFYEQQVYDVLHLNSDFRNLDFKHNLEEKTKIVERAETLAKEEDVNKAFKELQILHRLWKEEIGPVAREFREEIWDRFKTATKEIHDKRQAIMEELEAKWEENVPKKQEVVDKIKSLVSEEITSHNAWQNKIKEMQALRDEFFNLGKVPKEKSEELWQQLREVTKIFNKHKNAFYKEVKSTHQVNLDKKQALIDKANELKDAEDLEGTTEVFKKIQSEWKTIGHVPRKFSDKMWKEFRGACNHFFDRLHSVQDEANKELMVVFEQKKEYLENLKNSLSDDAEVAVNDVKKYIQEWKTFGSVPNNMRFIDSKFNKVIDKLFSKLDIDKQESAMMRFKNTMDSYIEANDTRKIENEAYFIRKKIDEITKEVKLLENNLGFFSNASPDNPMVKNVYKNIEKHQEDLDLWKNKLKYLREALK